MGSHLSTRNYTTYSWLSMPLVPTSPSSKAEKLYLSSVPQMRKTQRGPELYPVLTHLVPSLCRLMHKGSNGQGQDRMRPKVFCSTLCVLVGYSPCQTYHIKSSPPGSVSCSKDAPNDLRHRLASNCATPTRGELSVNGKTTSLGTVITKPGELWSRPSWQAMLEVYTYVKAFVKDREVLRTVSEGTTECLKPLAPNEGE